VALAPALRRLPALEGLYLDFNPFGDEGLAALVAPPLPAPGPLPPPTGGLAKLKWLDLSWTSYTPRSPTPAAPSSPLRSTAARCQRSRSSV